MSFHRQYKKLPPELQTDLFVAANCTSLRHMLAQQIGELQQELCSLQIPENLNTAAAIQFCLQYQQRQEQKDWLESLLSTFETCIQDFHKRQARQE